MPSNEIMFSDYENEEQIAAVAQHHQREALFCVH